MEKSYQDNMSREEALRLIAQGLSSSIDNPKINSQIAIIGSKGVEFLD